MKALTLKKTKTKKPSRKTLIKKLDKMFADTVKQEGLCELKGKDKINCKGSLQCMHIISRKYKALRWEFANAISGCQAHHYWYTNNPWEWNDLIKTHFRMKYDFVQEHKNDTWDKDLEKVLADLSK